LFADPIVAHVTVPTAGTTTAAKTGTGLETLNFVRTGVGPSSATYRCTLTSTHVIDLFISRAAGKRNRYTVRFTESEVVADAFDDNKNVPIVAVVYFVVDLGPRGVTTTFYKLAHSLAADFLFKYAGGEQGLPDLVAGNV